MDSYLQWSVNPEQKCFQFELSAADIVLFIQYVFNHYQHKTNKFLLFYRCLCSSWFCNLLVLLP